MTWLRDNNTRCGPKSAEELKVVQAACDHEWEFIEDDMKVCTYPECGLEVAVSGEELNDRADYFNELPWE